MLGLVRTKHYRGGEISSAVTCTQRGEKQRGTPDEWEILMCLLLIPEVKGGLQVSGLYHFDPKLIHCTKQDRVKWKKEESVLSKGISTNCAKGTKVDVPKPRPLGAILALAHLLPSLWFFPHPTHPGKNSEVPRMSEKSWCVSYWFLGSKEAYRFLGCTILTPS